MPTSYLLKITLEEVHHPIWRRFVVPSNIPLNRLHDVVQSVMGWEDCHIHAFIVGKQHYLPTYAIESNPFDDGNDLPEEEYTFESLIARKGAKIKYWYDFGDSWMHEIVVESIDYTNPDWPYPICCIEGVRACPPEDCGSTPGFVDFCEAMTDPKHPEHEEFKEWYGSKYNPDRFDLEAVNKKLGIKRSAKKATKKGKPRSTMGAPGNPDEK